MTTERQQVSAEFGGLVELTGWRYEMHGIEIVLDDEYSDDEGVTILDDSASTLDAVHPAVRAKLTQILFPRLHHAGEPLKKRGRDRVA